jgi:hypothetical protein
MKMKMGGAWLGLALGAATCLACAHREPERRVERAPIVESRADWTRLGERTVDGVNDRDVIHVGAREGRYRRIMIVVERSALEMHDVVVTFGDGETFSPSTRLVFEENSRSRIIDLPGATRVIRSVEFRYGNLPGGGRAVAELWAQ